MLFLIFHLSAERYALDCRQIAAVLPERALKTLPGAPSWVAGVLDYRGAPVPVIDVPALALGRPAAHRLSTRIVLVDYPFPGERTTYESAAGVTEPIAARDGATAAADADGDATAVTGGTRLLGLVVEQATRTLRLEASAFVSSGIATPHARYLGPVAHDVDGMLQRVDIAQLLPADVRRLLFETEPVDAR
jgi:chemotaxis-related protein WspB